MGVGHPPAAAVRRPRPAMGGKNTYRNDGWPAQTSERYYKIPATSEP